MPLRFAIFTAVFVASTVTFCGTRSAFATDHASGTFTYQGVLKHNDEPVTTPVNLAFRLYDAENGGNQIGPQLDLIDFTPDDGHLTVDLNFGVGAFPGDARWLEVFINGAPLSPRQPIMAAPYAMTAAHVPGKAVTGQYYGITAVGTLEELQVAGNVGIGSTGWPDTRVTIETSPSENMTGLNVYLANPTQGNVGIGAYVEGPNSMAMNGNSQASTGWGIGILGQANSADLAYGVWGAATATTGDGVGGYFRSNSNIGIGVHGWVPSTSGATRAVWGRTNSPDGYAGYFTGPSGSRNYFQRPVGIGITDPAHTLHVSGQIRASSNSWVIRGDRLQQSGTFPGVWGTTESASSGTAGVRGDANHTSPGATAAGVYGINHATGNNGYGVRGVHSGSGVGVHGQASSGSGVGVRGEAPSTGVRGTATGTFGVGISGIATASSGATVGVYGNVSSTAGTAVYAFASASSGFTEGVYARVNSTSGYGVYGYASTTSGSNFGVLGYTNSHTNGWGVWSNGRFGASGTKSFQIDHPLDPENKYLLHYSTESPEPLNVYRGRAIFDASGEAWIDLPDYFEALNRDPLYHLTAIGGSMPNLHIAREVDGNRFLIAGGAPGKSVSWRVEAVRNDAFVRNVGAPVEVEKPEDQRGTYLHPEFHDQPRERGRFYRQDHADFLAQPIDDETVNETAEDNTTDIADTLGTNIAGVQ